MKQYLPDDIICMALLGHAGCGKTQMADSLLHIGKVSNRWGKVDEKCSNFDCEEEEVSRQTTIFAKYGGVPWKNKKINIIDTPGYYDFVGEVHKSLIISDVACILVDANSSVQVDTENVNKYSKLYNIPRIFFVNKMDKENTDFDKVVNEIQNKLEKTAVPVQIPICNGTEFKSIIDILGMTAYDVTSFPAKKIDIPSEKKGEVDTLRVKLVETAVESDDLLTEKYLDGKTLSDVEIARCFSKSLIEGSLIPILCGAGLNLMGLDIFLNFIADTAPTLISRGGFPIVDDNNIPTGEKLKPEPEGKTVAFAWKTIIEPHLGELTYFRVLSGALKTGMEITNISNDEKEKIGHLASMNGKQKDEISTIPTGDLGVAAKLKKTRCNEVLIKDAEMIKLKKIDFPKPILKIAVAPETKKDQEKMGVGLHAFKAEDPTFNTSIDQEFAETLIEGMGEIHLETKLDILKKRYDVSVTREKPSIAYRETIRKSSKGEGKLKKQSGGRGQYGHCFLEISPMPAGAGYQFENTIFGGSIPSKYVPAIEKGVQETLNKGILAGYKIVDIKVSVYDGSYHDVDSSDMAFQVAGSLALRKAAESARMVLLEPIMEVDIIVPSDYTGDIIGDVNSRRGKIISMTPLADGLQCITAHVPESEMYKYANDLRSITSGHGNFSMKFSHYEEVPPQVSEKIIQESREK